MSAFGLWRFWLLAAVALQAILVAGKDYYEILGVNRKADESEMKKAYRNLSLVFHPDKCEGEKADCEEKFIEVSTAYEVLSDPEKRKTYDEHGEEGLKEGAQTGEHAANMFRQFFGREPDGKVKIVHQGGRMMFTEEGEPGPQGNIFDNTDVEEITSENFKAFVQDRDEPWAMLFYKPTQPEYGPEVRDEFMKLGTTYKGIVKIAAVNCRQQRDVCRGASITSWPALRWFSEDKNKDPEVWENGEINAKNLGKWVSTSMPDFTTILTDRRGLKEWLEAAKGPTALLFSDKRSSPPLWKSLSREFNHRAALGVVLNCDKNGVFKTELQKLYDVRIPNIIHVDPVAEIGQIAEKYDSKLNQTILSLWMKKLIGVQRKSGPVAAFKEWTNDRLKAGDCAETDSQFCFLWLKAGAEPVVEDAMRGLAKKYRTDPIKLMYVNTELNEGILSTFGLAEKMGEDIFVAYRPKRKKFKVYDGAMTFPALDGFIDGTLNGGPLTEKLKVDKLEL